MDNFISDIRPYFELLFFLSGIIVAAAALYATRQVSLMKADMKMRSERAAKEKAIEVSSDYLTVYIPLYDRFYREYTDKKIPDYHGPVGDFSPKSVPPQFKGDACQRVSLSSCLPALNKLESIAASFTVGVADERTAFPIIGREFCYNVESQYDDITFLRWMNPDQGNPYPFWENIVELYQIWSSRLKKEELSKAKDRLESQMKNIPDNHIPPIGP